MAAAETFRESHPCAGVGCFVARAHGASEQGIQFPGIRPVETGRTEFERSGSTGAFSWISRLQVNLRDHGGIRRGFGVKHNAVMSFIYEIPAAPAFRKGPGKFAFGAWLMNGLWTLRTGFPAPVPR